MRKRTLSREIALQILFAWDISREPVGDCRKKFFENNETPAVDEVVAFSDKIVAGVEEHK